MRRSQRGAWRSLLLLSALAMLAGCAVNPPLDLSERGVVQPPAVTLDAPFYPQTENQCGPAALATVLAASGVETAPERLAPEVYLPSREGSLQIELVAATRRLGRIPWQLDPAVDALIAELRHGRPVLLLQNLRTRRFPAWHYAVLVGYDVPRNAFQLNSGTEQGLWLPAPRLLRTWDWGGRWAMVALRPGQLPADAGTADEAPGDPHRFFESLANFEAVAGNDAALPAWQAAAQHWPAHPGPALALGNHAYQQGQLAEAVRWFEQGLARKPEDPVLANNLASVLGEAGCARAGEAVLRPVAARLDRESVWAAAVDGTLEELAARSGGDPDRCADFASITGAVDGLP